MTDFDAPNEQQMKEFMDRFAPEELHPDLQFYVVERPISTVLHHPLVIMLFFNPSLHRMANLQYAQKKQLTKEAHDNEDWTQYVYLYERPYRLAAFAHIADEIMEADEADYWELLGDIWIDSESIGADLDVWQDMLAAGDPEMRHRHFMTDEEREKLLHLTMTGPVTIYRGVSAENRLESMSWTLDKTTAEWFARRFHGHGRLLTATVDPSYIIALRLGRGESEVIIDPDNVPWRVSRVTPIKSR